MNWLFVLASVISASLSWTLISVISNYNAARKIGFPIIISPLSPLNPLWIVAYKVFPKILLLQGLPFGLGTWARCTYIGWTFQDKHALHDELGLIFVLVTPSGNDVTVADPQAVHTIMSRRKEFIKPAVIYEQLNIFGRNLNTVEGEDWQRQRRLIAPNFNERTSWLVWNEALRQARDMAQSWSNQGAAGTKETVVDTASLALHVLTSVGFGLTYPFHGGVRDLPPGHSMTYRDSLSLCLRNIIIFTILGKKILSSWFLPKKLRTLGVATQEFQKYMEELLAHERKSTTNREEGPGNLIRALVRVSEEAQQPEDKVEFTRLGLTDDEIFGNIFTFNLAGHETTANTLATAIVLLAAKPKYQKWISEEIDGCLLDKSSPNEWAYEATFHKLQRCLAVMYETLRLYGSIVFIPKSTGFHTQSLTLNDKTHVLPPNTAVTINVQALHTDPNVWGPDALEWKPSRWLKASNSSRDRGDSLTAETFVEPEAGSFIPWADGPRACVGKKFSQVEFVAVLAVLFRQYQVRPVLQEGETEVDARKALIYMADNSAISAITLQMQDPRSRSLRWDKRTLNDETPVSLP